MKISMTLQRYLAGHYLANMLGILFILLAIIYLFDTVELMRRANKQENLPLSLVLHMGLLKLPEVGQMILPFAVLFSAIFTFWKLTRRYELIIVRAAGFSVWQFLAPVIAVALAFGFFNLSVINPLGALFLSKFESMENDYLSHRQNFATIIEEGFWLRQEQEDGYVILHASEIDPASWELTGVMAMFFDHGDNFERRIDSETARLQDGMWLFEQAYNNAPDSETEKLPLVALPTELTIQELEESFASPETMSFWNLPEFIRIMEETGFDATRLKIHYQSLLAQPLLFAAMILLAAAVSLRPPRTRGTAGLIVAGVILGLLIFFLSSFLQALGASHQIPAILAAWAPAVVTILLGSAIMLNLEDG